MNERWEKIERLYPQAPPANTAMNPPPLQSLTRAAAVPSLADNARPARVIARSVSQTLGVENMPDVMAIADIAKRLNLDATAIRRLIAKESDALGFELRRGKGDRLLLSKEDVECPASPA
jgi:hypothetical protein